MKKFITLMLVALMLLVYVPVTSAETQSFYSVLNNSGTSVAVGHRYTTKKSTNPDEYDLTGCYSFSVVDAYVKFSIDVPKDGKYNLYAYYGSAGNNTVKVTEGENVLSQTTISGNGTHYYVFKRLITANTEFTKGTHDIKLTNVQGSGMLFGIGVENAPSDEIYVDKSDSTTVFDGVVTMIRSGWISYKINPEKSGRYLIKLNAKSSVETFINVSVNDESATNISLTESADYVENYTYLDLSEGAGTLKLYNENENGKISFNSFELVELPGTIADEKAFVEAVNQSSETIDVHTAFETFGDALGINIEELTKDIFYKDAVYSALIDRDFDSATEIMNTLSEKISQEKASPTVALKSNGEKIDELKSGDFTFEIDNAKAKLNSSVLVGVYKKIGIAKKLIAVSGLTAISDSKVTANFTNMDIENPENYTWKIFNLQNKETIKPYNAYSNIYKEFYVSATGSDSADGSKNSPFRTLNKAKQAAAEISDNMTGDIVINIAGGEYFISETLNFTPENSGKNGYNIVYRGMGTKTNPTVISGGKQVTEWTESSNGVWEAPLSGVSEVRNLYIDGIAAERARSAYAHIYLEDYDDETTQTTLDGFVTSTEQLPDFEHPEDLETVWEIGWECQRAPVATIKMVDGKKAVILENGDYWKVGRGGGASAKSLVVGRRFYFENAKELVDTEGEFFYDKREDKIYYYPYEEENLKTAKTYVAVTEKLVDISGTSKTNKVKNLVFDNIDFKYGAWNKVSTHGLMGHQTESYYDYETKEVGSFVFPGQFSMHMTNNVKIKNCEFSSLGSVAVTMRDGVSDVLFEGNIIKDTSGAALSIGTVEHSDAKITSSQEVCRNITVKNNVLRRISTEYRQEAAINTYCENAVTIKNNDIRHTPYTAISAGWGWGTSNSKHLRNLDISNNKIVGAMENLLDGASIYTLGPIFEGRIVGNYTADNRLRNTVGIYLDAGSANLNVHDNLIFSNELYFIRMQAGYYVRNNKVYNNYSNTSKPSPTSTAINTPEYPNDFENAIVVDRNNLPAEAQSIYDGAGVEAEFAHLLSDVETPAYMRNYNITKPKREFIDCVGEVVEFENYITAKNFSHYGYEVGMTSSGEATFEVNMSEAGMYDMHIPNVTTFRNTPVNIDVNSGMKYNITIPYDSETKALQNETVLVYLEAGKNTIKIETPVGSAHFDCFYFTKSDEEINTFTIEAEKFDNEGLLDVSSVGASSVSFHPGGWLEYNVYSLEDAEYTLSVFTATQQRYLYMTVDVNETTSVLTSPNLPNTGDYTSYKETVVGTVSLNKGFNRIRLNLKTRSTVNGLHFDKFVLTK